MPSISPSANTMWQNNIHVYLSNHTPAKAILCPVSTSVGFHLSAVIVTHSLDILSLSLHFWTTDGLSLLCFPQHLFIAFKEALAEFPWPPWMGYFLPSHLGRIWCLTPPSPPPSTQTLCLHWSKCCSFSTDITTQFAFAVSLCCSSRLLTQNTLWIVFANREHLKSHHLLSHWFIAGSTNCSKAVPRGCLQIDRRSLCAARGRGWLCDLWHPSNLKGSFSQPEELIFHCTAE